MLLEDSDYLFLEDIHIISYNKIKKMKDFMEEFEKNPDKLIYLLIEYQYGSVFAHVDNDLYENLPEKIYSNDYLTFRDVLDGDYLEFIDAEIKKVTKTLIHFRELWEYVEANKEEQPYFFVKKVKVT
jgi:hypothetical protein